MNYIRLGNSGLKITEITYGTALTIGTENSDFNYAQKMIDTAWELGIRSFDTSNNYGMGQAEVLLGKILLKYKRDEYVLATKGSWPIGDSVYHRGLSRKHILWAVENSLKRLNMDYIDIYYAHRYDPEVSMEEIVRTFNLLIRQDKIRYWATSEWPVEALIDCHDICDKLGLEKPIVEQSIYSFAIRKIETNGVKEFCDDNHVALMGFSPLAQGFLTGKYKDGIPKDSRVGKSEKLNYNKSINIYNQNKERIDKFVQLCEEEKLNSTHVAIKWCLLNKIYPVLGASKPGQLINSLSYKDTILPNNVIEKLKTI